MPDPTNYLPVGWTEERLANATEEDLSTLSELELLAIRDRWAAETWASIEASEAQQSQNGSTEDGRTKLAPIVEVLRSEHIDGEWGFVVFRTAYHNDADWTQFRGKWDEEIESQLDPGDGNGIEEVVGRLKFHWVENQARLTDVGPSEVRNYFRQMRDRGEIPPGLDVQVCLVVSKYSIASFLPQSQHEGSLPYVIAVDVEYDDEDVDNGDYRGHFKVAARSLLDELFVILAKQILVPEELAATLDDDEAVWDGM